MAFVPVVRDAGRWRATGMGVAPMIADLTDPASLAAALGGADIVVSGAHARHIPAILDAAPPCGRFVFLGSTRKYTQWPDAHARGVLDGEAAFIRAGRSGVILHPTMIYGSAGEDNVQRLVPLLRRLPVVPLPGGGQALVRPIHQDDVTRAIRAALGRDWAGPQSVVIAGADSVRYADFVRAVARAAGLKPPRIVALPGALLRLAAPLTRVLPGLPTIRGPEVRRLLEDKSFDIGPMQAVLGVKPMGLVEGLALTFQRR